VIAHITVGKTPVDIDIDAQSLENHRVLGEDTSSAC
jgi:hypothetical protein